jgi:hypothetical protein
MTIFGHLLKREQAKSENAPTIHLSAEQNRERRHSMAQLVGESSRFREFGRDYQS